MSESIRIFEQAAMSAPQTHAAQFHDEHGARAGVDAWDHSLERLPQELATEFLARHESKASP